MRSLLEPIVSHFDSVLQQLVVATDPKLQLMYAEQLNQAVSFARYGH